MASTQDLIETAVERSTDEVPALAKLKLVFELELRGRGDVQLFRVEVPGPKITKEMADDARVTVEIVRSNFNELAADGTVKDYRRAWDEGHIKASGDPAILKLIGQVIERHELRAGTKKVR
ncbi:hypothetical protein BH20ACT15_BH20ACT15_02940 [soil metagenome]